MQGGSYLSQPYQAASERGFRLLHDEQTRTWVLLDVTGNIHWRGVSFPAMPPFRPRPPDTLARHLVPTVLPQQQFALAAHAAEANLYASRPSTHTSTTLNANSGYRIEVLAQTVYDRGLSSDYHFPDIAFGGIKLRDALSNDFGSLADPDGAAWPESFQTPQKLAVVLCFYGYGKYGRQANVLRHVQAHTLPPTRAKIAHVVASVVNGFLIETGRDPDKYPVGLLSHCGRPLTLDDLVLIDVQHASKGSLQPTIGVMVRV